MSRERRDGPTPRNDGGDPLLSVRDLRTHFRTDRGTVRAVDGVSFDAYPGETVCLVGESGSGKTVTCESIARLVPDPPGEYVGGEVRLDDRDLLKASESELEAIRGARVSYVFQNPGNALDPVYAVGEQVAEAVRYHNDCGAREARERAVDLLDRVGIPDAPTRAHDHPHRFSGGMKQRVVLALALANDPDLLVADEPTTALDVTIQAQILDLIADLQAERDLSLLFVTHDLGVVAGIADRVVVMYGGKVMERGSVTDVFDRPAHPYTRALLECLPGRGDRTEPIGGSPPDPVDPPAGCRFHPRCDHAIEPCRTGDQPPVHGVERGRAVSCVFYDGSRDPGVLDGDPVEPGTDTSGDGEGSAASDGGDSPGGDDDDPPAGGGRARGGGDR
ncbi:ABC transporter ATP-binding protein [Halobaculum sp. EA56]|uniref:ABC transporter ATP-binding protein n=1 Tax=Halobaculum sp. EA56 TaxID=3421648 RepID=UPI003EB777E6